MLLLNKVSHPSSSLGLVALLVFLSCVSTVTAYFVEPQQWRKLSDENPPTAFDGSTLVADSTSSTVYLYGKCVQEFDPGCDGTAHQWSAGIWSIDMSQDAPSWITRKTYNAYRSDIGGGAGTRQGAVWFHAGCSIVDPNDDDHQKIMLWGGVTYAGSALDPNSGTALNTYIYYDIEDNTVEYPGSQGGNFPFNGIEAATCVQVSDTHVIIFGGASGPPNKNWTISYDISNPSSNYQTNRTEQILFADPVTGEIIGDYEDGYEIAGRAGHSADLMYRIEIFNESGTQFEVEHPVMMVFGGHGDQTFFGNSKFFDDLWQYDVESGTWRFMDPEGGRPTGRCYHATTVAENVLFMFGGDTASMRHNDELWAYSIEINRWAFIEVSGISPEERAHHALVKVAGQPLLLLFGGLSFEPTGLAYRLNDAWAFGLACPNNCSGNGDCFGSIVCFCDPCWTGSDCSVPGVTGPECVTVNEQEPEDNTGEEAGWIIGVIVGALLAALAFCVLLLLLLLLLLWVALRKWKKNKMRESTKGGETEMSQLNE